MADEHELVTLRDVHDKMVELIRSLQAVDDPEVRDLAVLFDQLQDVLGEFVKGATVDLATLRWYRDSPRIYKSRRPCS